MNTQIEKIEAKIEELKAEVQRLKEQESEQSYTFKKNLPIEVAWYSNNIFKRPQ